MKEVWNKGYWVCGFNSSYSEIDYEPCLKKHMDYPKHTRNLFLRGFWFDLHSDGGVEHSWQGLSFSQAYL